MEAWMLKEEEKNTVEFIKQKTLYLPSKETSILWHKKQVYVCSCSLSGGKSKYTKKHNWGRVVPTKKLEEGCPCRLTIKTYVYTDNTLTRSSGSTTTTTLMRQETQIHASRGCARIPEMK
jgi:hypothetical protein